MIYDNGDCYKGAFFDGKYNGYGEYHWANGNYYIGNWVDDKRDGYGEYHYNDQYYIGNFINDEANGYVEYYYADGSYYKGNWASNQPDGYGTEYIPDVGIFSGTYVYGVRDGTFLVEDTVTGKKHYEYYSNGTFIGY